MLLPITNRLYQPIWLQDKHLETLHVSSFFPAALGKLELAHGEALGFLSYIQQSPRMVASLWVKIWAVG